MTKRVLAILISSFLVALSALLAPAGTLPAEASSGSSDVGGGGSNQAGETNNNAGANSLPLCYYPTVSGEYASKIYYYNPPFTGCIDSYGKVAQKNPNKNMPSFTGSKLDEEKASTWLPGVAQCTIGFDEFRFYGTADNPVQAATLSRVNTLDRCLPSDVAFSRVFYPNPKDAGGVPAGTVWNTVGNAINHHKDPLNLSDNCSASMKYPNCLTTSLPPRAKIGDCKNLIVRGENSIKAYLQSPNTPEEFKSKIQNALLSQYNLVNASAKRAGSLYPNARAAASIDVPFGSLRSAPSISAASSISGIGDAYECSSAVEFIPVQKETGRAPVVIGACVVPLVLDSKVYAAPGSGVTPSNYDPNEVTKFLDGELKTNKFTFNYVGPWATFNDLRYSNKKAKLSNPGSGLFISEIAKNITPPTAAYQNAIKTLVRRDPAPSGPPISGTVPKATDYASFNLPRNFDHYATPGDPVYEKSQDLRRDRSAAANRAASSATCWSMELAASFDFDSLPEIPATTTDPVVPEPPSMLPPSSSVNPVNPVPSLPPSVGSPGDNNLSVTVTVNPKEFYAGGRDFDNYLSLNDIRVNLTPRLTTNCNAINSGWCMTDISPLYGTIRLDPSSNYPSTFPGCSGPNCQSYESRSNPGRVNLQGSGNPRVTPIWNFYSPTAQGQWMNLSIQNPSLTYVLREKVWRTVKVGERQREECRPALRPNRPPRCTTVTEDIFEPRPFIEYRRTVTVTNVQFRVDGSASPQSLSRPVVGTIGR